MKKIIFTFLTLFLITINCKSQLSYIALIGQLSDMPEPISNNAVVEGWANGVPYIFSFGGIDSTKLWSGIHLKAFRYNTVTNIWDTIPSLPDTLGKIASAASWVDSVIYIIGGYHVYANSNEASSAKVHRFDPRTNTYLSDGMDIPVPIDDHVQAVWNDSLIYVITGWSNSGNVPNVQIYDPANNNWLVGTPTPNNNTYKAFGASGIIIGNTIYYHGGASNSLNFPGQSILRIGQINPTNPTQITWSMQNTNFITYRSACVESFGNPFWIGGSELTYNYNGIAYNGSGGVPNKSSILGYEIGTFDSIMMTSILLPIDLRGVAINNNGYYLAGGMDSQQKVSKNTYLIQIPIFDGIDEQKSLPFKTYPNPTASHINLLFDEIENKTIQLIDVVGNEVLKLQSHSNNIQLDVSTYPKGIYFIKVTSEKESSTQKIIIK